MIKDVIIHNLVVRMNTDENALETALRIAITDPTKRSEFCRVLLESDVFVLTVSDLPDRAVATLKSDIDVSLKCWQNSAGSVFLPFFSSRNVLQRSIKSKERYIGLPAKTLFAISRGKTLFLNPRGPHGKEFFPHEVEALLLQYEDSQSVSGKH